MSRFTIDTENNIPAHAGLPGAFRIAVSRWLSAVDFQKAVQLNR
jgi:hypothetical protein